MTIRAASVCKVAEWVNGHWSQIEPILITVLIALWVMIALQWITGRTIDDLIRSLFRDRQ